MKTTNLKVYSFFITGFLLMVLAGCGTPASSAAPVAASGSSPEQPAEAIQFYLTADALPVEVTHGNNPVLSLTKGQTIPISTNDKIAVGDGGIGKLLYSDRITVEILQGTELVLGNVTTVAGDRIEASLILNFGHTHITIGENAKASIVLKTNDSTITSLADNTEFSVCYAPGKDGLTCHPVMKGTIQVFGATGKPQVYTAPPSVGTYTFNGQAPQPPICFHEQEYRDWLSQMRNGEKVEALGALVDHWYKSPCPADTSSQMAMETPTQMAMETPTQMSMATTAPSSEYFTEEFTTDGVLNNWQSFQWNNTAPGINLPMDGMTPMVKDGYLVFELPKPALSIFAIYDPGSFGNVKISVSAHNSGQNSSIVSLICRYSSEGWYEFQIGNNGLFSILGYMAFEQKYYTLHSGGSTSIHTGMGVNEYSATCIDNELSLFINGTKAVTVKDTMHQLGDGKVGMAVSSTNGFPIEEQINWFKTEQP